MSDQEQIALLTEIRDLQRQNLDLAQQALNNQAQALANQQRAIDRQVTNQQILTRTRKWTRILLGLVLLAAILYLLQPLLFLWFARPP
jgi:hypothetical protein